MNLNNIFCSSNPAKLIDALWIFIKNDISFFNNIIIFLPNNRTVKTFSNFIKKKLKNTVILPKLIALGEDDFEEDDNVIINSERLFLLSKLLIDSGYINDFSNSIKMASELIKLQDYLANDGIDIRQINWSNYISNNVSKYFKDKLDFLNLLNIVNSNFITETEHRNNSIINWKNKLKDYKKIIVCGSTASIKSTSSLMEYISSLDNGYIIFPGKIYGEDEDLVIPSNPYHSQYKFLKKINKEIKDISIIDNGISNIDFFNKAFSNTVEEYSGIENISLIECDKDSIEAEYISKITKQALSDNKSVLIITPDIVANERLYEYFKNENINANFSSGTKLSHSILGRFLLNILNDYNDKGLLYNEYIKNNFDILKTVNSIIDFNKENIQSIIDLDNDNFKLIFDNLENLSGILYKYEIKIKSSNDIIDIIRYILNSITIRPKEEEIDYKVSVLGTIESRMQTADIVILSGLNEGTFPKFGYNNNWFSKKIMEKVGMSSPDKKISLMALDFMILSSNSKVYWLRSKISNGLQTIESRFLTRVKLTSRNNFNQTNIGFDYNIKYIPLDNSFYGVPIKDNVLYITDLDYLINNPYIYYVKKILKLDKRKDFWEDVDARDFGKIVHSVLETADNFDKNYLIKKMEEEAKKNISENNILFYFWKKRFVDIANISDNFFKKIPLFYSEIEGYFFINDKKIKARADKIWDGVVLDIKTASKLPTEKKLKEGMSPQLPLEAYIMKVNGFGKFNSEKSKTPVIKFLHLANNNIDIIEYDETDTDLFIKSTLEKVKEILDKFSQNTISYEYNTETLDLSYQQFRDLARILD